MVDTSHGTNCGDPKWWSKIVGESTNVPENEPTGSSYPNPVSGAVDFKTTIPFVLTEEGFARLTVYDPTGKVVLNDEQEFSGVGKHYFYLTIKQLPSGTYHYSVTSVRGTVLNSNSIVVVK
jgi:hypothetical protein